MESCTFSVIIPTRNRPGRLEKCLASIAALDPVPGGFEVIVVDDGGTQPLDPVCSAFADRIDLHLLRQSPGGPGAARNTGAIRARGTYLAFTADDCRPSGDWLLRLGDGFARHPGHLLGGKILNGLPDEVLATANHLLIDYLTIAAGGAGGSIPFFTPNNMAVPAEQFRSIGGFDAAMGVTGEDRELCRRWQGHGFQLAFADEAAVTHFHPQTLAGFFGQHVGYGRGSLRFHHRASAAGRKRGGGLLPEAPGFYWRLLTYPTRSAPFPRAALLSTALAVSQIANGCGFLLETVRRVVGAGTPRASLEPLTRSGSIPSSGPVNHSDHRS